MKKLFFIILTLIIAASCTKDDDGTIFGTASADDGNVLSGITVKLYAESTQFLRDTTTDTEGNFTFTGVEEGNYYIGATITVDGVVWDSGNLPQIFYVGGETEREVVLTLTQKN